MVANLSSNLSSKNATLPSLFRWHGTPVPCFHLRPRHLPELYPEAAQVAWIDPGQAGRGAVAIDLDAHAERAEALDLLRQVAHVDGELELALAVLRQAPAERLRRVRAL